MAVTLSEARVTFDATPSDACPYCGNIDREPSSHIQGGRCSTEPAPFVPVWRRRALAGKGVSKDMTGTVAA